MAAVTENDAGKKSNFASLGNPNGITRNSGMNPKSGATKKLVIKNFRGKREWMMRL